MSGTTAVSAAFADDVEWRVVNAGPRRTYSRCFFQDYPNTNVTYGINNKQSREHPDSGDVQRKHLSDYHPHTQQMILSYVHED